MIEIKSAAGGKLYTCKESVKNVKSVMQKIIWEKWESWDNKTLGLSANSQKSQNSQLKKSYNANKQIEAKFIQAKHVPKRWARRKKLVHGKRDEGVKRTKWNETMRLWDFSETL